MTTKLWSPLAAQPPLVWPLVALQLQVVARGVQVAVPRLQVAAPGW